MLLSLGGTGEICFSVLAKLFGALVKETRYAQRYLEAHEIAWCSVTCLTLF